MPIFTNARPSRRSFLIGSSAVAGAALLPLNSWAQAAAPSRGGTALVAFQSASPADTLDPVRATSDIDSNRCTQIYSTLVRLDKDRRPQPNLAESFEPGKPDATEWIFRLRKGLTFHDGRMISGKDVAFSYQRHVGPDSTSAIKSLLTQITDIKAEDDLVIRIVLKAPNAEFPAALTDPRAGIVPDGQNDFSSPVGSGPMKVEAFQPGERAHFVRFAEYWDAEHVYLDGIETFSIPDPASRLNALLAGEIHFAIGVDVKSLPTLESSDTVKAVLARSGQVVDIAMVVDQKPFDNADFRLAMKLLQDRQKVVDNIYKGHAQLGNDHEVAPNDPVYASDIAMREYDPEQAKFLLKKAGMENASVDLFTSTGAGPGAVEQALLLQQTAKAAGLTINVNQVPADDYWKSTWMKRSMFSSQWNVRANSDALWGAVHNSQSSSNETRFKSEKIDGLLLSARSELDEAKRRQHWRDLQAIVRDEGGSLVSAFPDYLHARHISFDGEVLSHPMGARGGFLSGVGISLNEA